MGETPFEVFFLLDLSTMTYCFIFISCKTNYCGSDTTINI